MLLGHIKAAFASCAIGVIASVCLSPLTVRAATVEDPCKTIPRAVVERAIGGKIFIAIPRHDGNTRSCGYRTSPTSAISIVTALRYDSASAAKKDVFQQASEAADGFLMMPIFIPKVEDTIVVGGRIVACKGTAIYIFGAINGQRQTQPLPTTMQLAIAVMEHVKP